MGSSWSVTPERVDVATEASEEAGDEDRTSKGRCSTGTSASVSVSKPPSVSQVGEGNDVDVPEVGSDDDAELIPRRWRCQRPVRDERRGKRTS